MRRVILLGLLWLAMLVVARVAGAQRMSYDSSEKVHSVLKTDIPSDTSAKPVPFKVKVADGDGHYFKTAMGPHARPYIVTFAPAAAAENANTAIEECLLTAVSGDSITISTRGEQNTSPQHWAIGSYVGIRVTYTQIGRLADTTEYHTYQIDSIRSVMGPSSFLPSQTGQSGKALTTNGSTLAWTAQPGSVVPVSLGGTNLTTVHAGKLIYGSSTGVFSELSVGAGLSILSGVLSASFGSLTTDNLAEGTINKYFTTGRARAAIAATVPIHDTGGVIYMHAASATDSGWVSPAKFNEWDAKQAALAFPLAPSLGGTGATSFRAAFYTAFDTTGRPDTTFLRKDGTWAVGGGGGGGGSVTSVTLAQSGGLLSLTGTNPITSSGTITLGLASQSANLLFASPNGSSGAPTFRAMVAGDIPNALVTNAKLANSSVTVTAGTGLTGGGAVSLGSSVTLTNDGVRQLIGGTGITVDTAKGIVTVTNAGVTSIAGTANQVIASAATGAVTLSTPQSIGTGSVPTFAGLTLSSPLTVANGGSGRATLTAHTLQVGAGTSPMVELSNGTTNQVLHANSSADPAWSAVSLATDVTGQLPSASIADSNVTASKIATGAVDLTKQVSGILPVANGGIGAGTLASNGVLYGNGASAVQALAVNSTATNKLLTQSSSAAPAWAVLVSGDVPNNAANTTGSAATLTTPRAIYGNNFDGSAALTQIIASTYGGTGNGFAKLSGPAASEKTFTLPNASATILTDNAVVTVGQGGTGLATLPAHALQVGNGTSAITQLGLGTTTTLLHGNATGDPTWSAVSLANDVTGTLTLTSQVTGILPIANGGTDTAALGTHGVLIGEGSNGVNTSVSDGKGPSWIGEALTTNGSSLDPSMQIQSFGFTGSADTAGLENVSGSGVLTYTKKVSNAAASLTNCVLASIQRDANSTSSGYLLNLDSAGGRTNGQFDFSLKRSTNANVGNNEGVSGAYFIPTSFANGTGYSTALWVGKHGPSVQNLDTAMSIPSVHAGSLVFLTAERNGASAASVMYDANVFAQSEGSVTVRIRRQLNASMGTTEGFRLNLAVLQSTPDGKITCGSSIATSPSGKDSVLDTITCANITASSRVLLTSVFNANSNGTQFTYGLELEPIANWPAGKFIVRAHRFYDLSWSTNESVTINYAVINQNPPLTSQQNFNFAGAPIAITATGSQLVLGGGATSGTTTTINSVPPAANQAYVIPDFGQGGTFMLEHTGGAASTCGTGTLAAGTVTINTTAALTGSLVFVTDTKGSALLANIGSLTVSAISNGVSFTVTSTNVADNSTFNWFILNP